MPSITGSHIRRSLSFGDRPRNTEPLTKPLTKPAKFSSLPGDCLKVVFAHTSLFDITGYKGWQRPEIHYF